MFPRSVRVFLRYLGAPSSHIRKKKMPILISLFPTYSTFPWEARDTPPEVMLSKKVVVFVAAAVLVEAVSQMGRLFSDGKTLFRLIV